MENWSIAACEVILLAGASVVGWGSREFWRVPRRLWLPALLVVVLLAVGLAQLVPLPASLWKACGAERYTMYERAARAEALLHTDAYRRDPFSAEAEKPLPPENWTPRTPKAPAWIPPSFTPPATFRALLALAAGLCLILLLERLAEEGRDALRRLAWLVGGLGLFVALAALAEFQDKARTTILWVRPSARAAGAFGPFVNPNHGAAFVNLAVPLLYYLIWRLSCATARRSDRFGLRLLCLGLFALHVAVLFASHSQGSLLALLFYPLAWLANGALHPSRPWRLALAWVFLAALLCGGALAAWSGLVSDRGRLRLGANVPAHGFALGHGLGSFEPQFAAESADLPFFPQMRNTHLENEYLQAFFEGGILPALAALATGVGVVYLAARLSLEAHAAFWLAPVLVGETLHAAVDFTAHVFPIVGALLLVCIVGMVALEVQLDAGGSAHKQRRRHGGPRRDEVTGEREAAG